MRLPLLVFVLVTACSSSSSVGAPSDASVDTLVDGGADAPFESSPPDAVVEAIDAACALHLPYSTKNKACNDCAAARCCVEMNACFDDPRCNDDYVNCALACALTDDAGPDGGAIAECLADCASKHPAGKARYDAAIGCAEAQCKSSCG